VGTGIEYREFTTADPNNLFVTRMDRTNLLVTLESSIAQGRLSGGTETVRGCSTGTTKLSTTGGELGLRNDVVVAINGTSMT